MRIYSFFNNQKRIFGYWSEYLMISHCGWDFDADIVETSDSYKKDMFCDCAYCKNFRATADLLTDEIKIFLIQFGIDIYKPIEAWSTNANKNKNLVEYVLYYAVNGTATSKEGFEIDFDNINIVVQKADNSPTTNMNEPYFVFELFNVWLPWVVDDDINECYPDKKISFLKRLLKIFKYKK